MNGVYYTPFNGGQFDDLTTTESEEVKGAFGEGYGGGGNQQFDSFSFGNYHVVNQIGSAQLDQQQSSKCPAAFEENPGMVNQMSSYSTSASMSSVESYSSSGASSLGSNGKRISTSVSQLVVVLCECSGLFLFFSEKRRGPFRCPSWPATASTSTQTPRTP